MKPLTQAFGEERNRLTGKVKTSLSLNSLCTMTQANIDRPTQEHELLLGMDNGSVCISVLSIIY